MEKNSPNTKHKVYAGLMSWINVCWQLPWKQIDERKMYNLFTGHKILHKSSLSEENSIFHSSELQNGSHI